MYPLLGALLAMGAPLGLVALRQVVSGGPLLESVLADLGRDRLTYVYLSTSTTIAFVVLGLLLGRTADRLERASATDPLTRLANRRHFGERLSAELKRSARYGSPLALLLIDVDHLKEINDRHGHEAGDAALRSVANALSASCRGTDLAARWGGDEFTVLAPGIGALDAVKLAERIREALRHWSDLVSSIPVTVSVGVTDIVTAREATSEALYAAADTALYAAKSAGRDRAVLFRKDEAAIGGED